MALFVAGEPQRDSAAPAAAPASESLAGRQDQAVGKPRHARDCPVETEVAAICTCGALFRLAVESADDAPPAHALEKID